jgi:hypothetical protein
MSPKMVYKALAIKNIDIYVATATNALTGIVGVCAEKPQDYF